METQTITKQRKEFIIGSNISLDGIEIGDKLVYGGVTELVDSLSRGIIRTIRRLDKKIYENVIEVRERNLKNYSVDFGRFFGHENVSIVYFDKNINGHQHYYNLDELLREAKL